MNFKTTIALLILLLGALIVVLITRHQDENAPAPREHTLLDIDSNEVTRIQIAPASGPPLMLVKSTAPETQPMDRWRMTSPHDAPANLMAVDSLLQSILKLKSNAEIRTSGSDAPQTGLDKPQYRIEITVQDKPVKIDVGDALAVGNGVYARLEGKSNAEVVSADILDVLDKSATSVRDLRLIHQDSSQIKQIAIDNQHSHFIINVGRGQSTIHVGDKTMPADAMASSSLPYEIANLKAADFVVDPGEAERAQMGQPLMSIAISDQPYIAPPATAPATRTTPTIITFLNYTDLQKKEVYVKVSGSSSIARMAASAMEAFDKGPLEFRDKTVMAISPTQVSRIEIRRDVPAATQPTARKPEHPMIVLARRKQVPATQVAATMPKPSEWVLEAPKSDSADDVRVKQLLALVGPLTADKFIDPAPHVPADQTRYTLDLQTIAAGGQATPYTFEFFDAGDEKPLTAHYNDLWFEIDHHWVNLLSGDFEPRAGAAGEEPDEQPKITFPRR